MIPKLLIVTETRALCELEGVGHTQVGVTEYILSYQKIIDMVYQAPDKSA